jgi:hypothetical protein
MVEDIAATHAAWIARGLDPTPLEQGRTHTTFTVDDPDGHVLTVYSNHVVGVV